jgi:hypothetical protein
VTHTTFVDNKLGPGFGSAILVGPRFASSRPSELTLSYSIVADHTTLTTTRALHVQANASVGSTADLTSPNHFVGNSIDTNEGEAGSGTYVGFPGANVFDPSPSTFFVDPSTFDYHVDGTQPPTDGAAGSSEALDVDGASRSGSRDLGADEFGALAFGLSVAKVGVGSGTVTSTPAGIDCGADCTERYDEDTSVTLSPAAASGSVFLGWTGDADCIDGAVLMDHEMECVAQFVDDGYVPECHAADDHLVLTGQTVETTVTEEACLSITAGPDYIVGASGDVHFKAPSVVLRNGFEVRGSFTVTIGVP